MKKLIPGLLLLSLFFLSRCSKSSSHDPVTHDSSYVDLLSSVSFYGPNDKFLMDSFYYNQTGMTANLLLYGTSLNSPLETYSFQIDSINQRILSFDYSILANNANQFTKFDISYNPQGMVSAMVPEVGGSCRAGI